MKSQTITIYTDGAAKGNPGPAGWGAIIMLGEKVTEIGGRADHATNNQMELSAPIGALLFLKKHKITGSVQIFSDSKYVILGITEWIDAWMKNGWRNAAKKRVVNQELWEKLYKLNQELKPKWIYVKGHNSDKYNDRADEIASSFAENQPVKLRSK